MHVSLIVFFSKDLNKVFGDIIEECILAEKYSYYSLTGMKQIQFNNYIRENTYIFTMDMITIQDTHQLYCISS